MFDKLGYMPKINVEVGAVAAWPFPVGHEPKLAVKKPRVKKATTLRIRKAPPKKAK